MKKIKAKVLPFKKTIQSMSKSFENNTKFQKKIKIFILKSTQSKFNKKK